MKVRLDIAYDGGPFSGWQRQKNGQPTIQGTIESALSRIFDQPVSIMGSGRTDAGVHAFGQTAHFRPPKDPTDYKLLKGLNSLTPPEIVINRVRSAPDDFHAIASAEKKTYKYLILNSPIPSAFRHKYTTWIKHPLDLSYLNQLSQKIEGQKDFKSFQTSGTEVKSTVRRVFQAKWVQLPENVVEFTIVGDGFLKQMVRNLVGTMLDMHSQKAPGSLLEQILADGDRRSAFTTAPPHGLYLYKVSYPTALDNKCRKI